MLLSFHEWLKENAAITSRIGFDPLVSALEKIERRQGVMPFSGEFTGSDILAKHLGLDQQELDSIWKVKLLQKHPNGGWNINLDRFISVYKQIRGMNPTINKMGPAPTNLLPLPHAKVGQ